jgi:hypothetical protein
MASCTHIGATRVRLWLAILTQVQLGLDYVGLYSHRYNLGQDMAGYTHTGTISAGYTHTGTVRYS